MTFGTGCYAVDGNSEDGAFLRQMLQGATLGSQGTVGHLDCAVAAHSPTPTSGIVIGAGSVVIIGAESPGQGSYYAINDGVDTTLSIAPTGGSPRSDMVIARAEDPTWPGSPWGNPAAGQIVFPRVISGVSSSATSVPGGYSAIPLARIDMPAGKTVVQQSYITDLRQVCNPQRSTQMFAAAGVNPGTLATAISGITAWPPGASWAVPVPLYATQCIALFIISTVLYENIGNGVARGWEWVAVGSNINAPVVVSALTLYDVTPSSGGGRHVLAGGGPLAIPASIRGTTQTFQLAQTADGTNTGTFLADEGTNCTLICEFFQAAALS